MELVRVIILLDHQPALVAAFDQFHQAAKIDRAVTDFPPLLGGGIFEMEITDVTALVAEAVVLKLRGRVELVAPGTLPRDGKVIEQTVEDLPARIFQHEIDHLDGKLFVDYLSSLKRQRIRKKLEKEARQGLEPAPAHSAI